jgi:hypothetical protein
VSSPDPSRQLARRVANLARLLGNLSGVRRRRREVLQGRGELELEWHVQPQRPQQLERAL